MKKSKNATSSVNMYRVSPHQVIVRVIRSENSKKVVDESRTFNCNHTGGSVTEMLRSAREYRDILRKDFPSKWERLGAGLSTKSKIKKPVLVDRANELREQMIKTLMVVRGWSRTRALGVTNTLFNNSKNA